MPNLYNEYINVDVDKLEAATRQQSATVIWKDSQKLRINKIPKTYHKRWQISPTFLKNRATRHGQEEEMHAKKYFMEEKGSIICSDNKQLSARPYEITEGNKLLEVKCSALMLIIWIHWFLSTNMKCSRRVMLALDQTGSGGYYVQMQITMYCCGLKEAKLMVQKNADDYGIIDVLFYEDFVSATVRRLKKFYFTKIMPHRIVDDFHAKRLTLFSSYKWLLHQWSMYKQMSVRSQHC